MRKCYGKLLPAIRLIIECNENGHISAVLRKTTYVLPTSLISYSLMEALINGSSYPGLVINLCTHCKAKQNHSNPVQPVPVQRGPIPPCTIPPTQGTCPCMKYLLYVRTNVQFCMSIVYRVVHVRQPHSLCTGLC